MQTERSVRVRRVLWIVVPVLLVAMLALPKALAWGRHHVHAKSPAELTEHLDDKLEYVLDKVDASDAQRAKAHEIAERRAPELFALMSEGREARRALKDTLLAEQLDRARLDAARTRLDALADRATDVGLESVFELAEVLTPAQRKQIADRLARFEH